MELPWLTNMVKASWPSSEKVFALGPVTLRQVNFRIHDAFLTGTGNPRHQRINLTIDAPDSRDGEPLRLNFSADVEWPTEPEAQAKLVRDTIHSMILHEVDEWFSLNGENAFDPHAPESTG